MLPSTPPKILDLHALGVIIVMFWRTADNKSIVADYTAHSFSTIRVFLALFPALPCFSPCTPMDSQPQFRSSHSSINPAWLTWSTSMTAPTACVTKPVGYSRYLLVMNASMITSFSIVSHGYGRLSEILSAWIPAWQQVDSLMTSVLTSIPGLFTSAKARPFRCSSISESRSCEQHSTHQPQC